MALNEPVVVVEFAKILEGVVQVIEGGEGVNPEKLLFECPPEAFDAAVALGGADEGWAGVHAKKAQFGLEGAGDELGSVVMAQLDTQLHSIE